MPLDAETLLLATPECTNVLYERFIVGTEPRELCPLHRPASVFRPVTRTLLRLFGVGRGKRDEEAKPPPPAPATEGEPRPEKPPTSRVEAPQEPGNLLEAYFGQPAAKREQPRSAPTESKKTKKKAGARAGGG